MARKGKREKDDIDIRLKDDSGGEASTNKFCLIPSIMRFFGISKTLLLIVLLALLINMANGQICQSYEYYLTTGCTKCDSLFIGCDSCTSTECTSCKDGLFYMPDLKYCVSQSLPNYYLDYNTRKSLPCGNNCANCIDNIGCVDCLQSTDAAKSTFLSTTSGLGTCAACSTTLDSCLLCSSSTTCVARDSKVLATGEACVDSNCRICETDKATCNFCKTGFVLTAGSCVKKTCIVSNCKDCTDSVATTCLSCSKGFFLASATTCTTCSSNCAECSTGSTCTLCNSGYTMSTANTCVLSCDAGQYAQVSRVNPPLRDIFEKKTCIASSCHSTCGTCLNNSNLSSMCTSCALGKYLSVADSTKMTGSCVDKAAKTDNLDILIYVSNLPVDISRAENLQTGDIATPYSDLDKAFNAASRRAAPFSTKADGTIITIRIALFTGDHYVISKSYDWKSGVTMIDSKSERYGVTISPYFCSLNTTSSTTQCVPDSTTLKVYVKTGQRFSFKVPEKFAIQNIDFDFTDSVIPFYDDFGNCLTSRVRCCVLNTTAGEKLDKFDSGQTESCSVRRVQTANHFTMPLNYMFFGPNMDSINNGIVAIPEFTLKSCTFQNILFETNSIYVAYNAAKVTLADSIFTQISFKGSIIKDYLYKHFTTGTSADYIYQYATNAVARPAIKTLTTECALTQTCFDLSMTNNTFTNFFPLSESTATFYRVPSATNESSRLGVIADIKNWNGKVKIHSNTVNNIMMRYTQLNMNCLSFTYSVSSTGDITGLINIKGDAEVVFTQNTIQNVALTGQIFTITQSSPVKYMPIIVVGNTFNKVTNYFGTGVVVQVEHAITSEAQTAIAGDFETYLKSATEIPCSHVIVDRNTFNYVGGGYQTISLVTITCRGFATSTSLDLTSRLTTDRWSALDLSATPVKPYSVTVAIAGSGTQTYTYDLNIIQFSNNAFENVIYMGAGVVTFFSHIRMKVEANSFKYVGFYTEGLYRTMNPNLISPASVCGDYRVNGRFSSSGGVVYFSRCVDININGITIDEPRYVITNLDSNSFDAIFASFVDGVGNIMIRNCTFKNIQGILGAYNVGTLNLKTVMDTPLDVNGLTMNRLLKIINGNYGSFTIKDTKFENIYVRSSESITSSFLLDVPRNTSNIPRINNVLLSNLTFTNVYCYEKCLLVRLNYPVVVSGITFNQIGTTAPYTDTVGSSMNCINIHTKLDEVITVENAQFNGFASASAILVTDGTISATSGTGYHAVLKDVKIIGNTLTQSGIRVNSALSKVQITGLNFSSNTATNDYPSIRLTTIFDVIVENSLFAANKGVTASALYFNAFTVGNIKFKNTTFAGVTKENIATFDYSLKPSIVIVDSRNIIFENCTIQDYANVAQGAGIYTSNSVFTVTGSTFKNNQARQAGGIVLLNFANVTVTSTTFTGNEAVEGGCFYISDSSTLTLNACTITANKAANAAVFIALLSGKIKDNGSTITLNEATSENSVGLFLETIGSVLDGTTIQFNAMKKGTSNNGKAIFVIQSSIEVKNVKMGKNYAENEYRNFYSILSTLTVDNCTFDDDSTLYTNAQNSLVIGGFIYAANTNLIVTNSNFKNGIANEGGSIFAVLSTLSISGTTFDKNTALKTGGAIFGLINKQIMITSTTFSSNIATIGDALNIEKSDSVTTITGCTFTSTFSPSYTHFISNDVSIDNCTFMQTAKNVVSQLTSTELAKLRSGAAIAAEGRGFITVKNSIFKNMLTLYGIALIRETLLTEEATVVQYTLNNNTFENNTAYGSQGGAGLYLINPLYANVTANKFIGNNALNGDGGAIKVSCDNSFCKANVQSNTLTNNRAGTKGGAVSWNLVEPMNVLSNTYSGNTATIYGNKIGSVGEKIVSITQAQYEANKNTLGDVAVVTRRSLNSITTSNFKSGSVLDTKYAAIVDRYGYIVKYGNENNIEAKVTFSNENSFPSALTGTTTYPPENGVIAVNNLELTSAPGTNQTIKIQSNDLLNSNIQLEWKIEVRQCVVGEELKGSGACVTCPGPNYYLLDAPSDVTTCKECPESAVCFGGTEIYPAPTYWRESNSSDEFYLCYLDEACLGYDSATKDPKGECAPGYEGIKCGQCEPGYSRTGEFDCEKCPPLGLNIFISIMLFIALVVFVTLIVAFTLMSDAKSRFKLNVLMRVLLNHAQMMAICISFELSWPENISKMLGSLTPTTNIGTRFISIDCFIDSRNDDGTGENSLSLAFVRLIVYVALPIILVVASAIFWYIRYFFETRGMNKRDNYFQLRDSASMRDTKITTTNIVMLFLIHPSVVKGIFTLFLCDDIGGKTLLVKDLNVECYKGTHLYFIIFLAVPGILAWGIGIPFGAMRLLKYHKEELYTEKIKKELGFLYSGYKFPAYYWEELIMVRKMIIIFVATFISVEGKLFQVLVVLIIVSIFLALHCWRKPFQDPALNWLEGLSLCATFVTMYAGYFFLAGAKDGDVSTTSKNDFKLEPWIETVFFLAILFFQILFIIFWFYQLHIEVKRLFRDKWPKWYKKIYLRRKSAKIMEQSTVDLMVQKEKAVESYIEILDQLQNDIQFLWAEKDSGALINIKEFEYALVLAHQKFKKHEAIWKNKMNKVEEEKDTLFKKQSKMTKEEHTLQMRMKQLSQLEETKDQLKVDFDLPLILRGAASAPIKISKDRDNFKGNRSGFLETIKESTPTIAFLKKNKRFQKRKKKNSTIITAEPEQKLKNLLKTFMEPKEKIEEHVKSEETSFDESQEQEDDTDSNHLPHPTMNNKGLRKLITSGGMYRKEAETPDLATTSFFKDSSHSKVEIGNDNSRKVRFAAADDEEEKLEKLQPKKDFSVPIHKTKEFSEVLDPISLDTDRLYGKPDQNSRNAATNNFMNDNNGADATIDDVKDNYGFISDEEEQG